MLPSANGMHRIVLALPIVLGDESLIGPFPGGTWGPRALIRLVSVSKPHALGSQKEQTSSDVQMGLSGKHVIPVAVRIYPEH